MRKHTLIILVICTLTMIAVAYAFGWYDIISNKDAEHDSIFGSLDYFFNQVLPYWWLLIIIGSGILTGVGVLGYRLFKRMGG